MEKEVAKESEDPKKAKQSKISINIKDRFKKKAPVQ
jgi:hypothetical protein